MAIAHAADQLVVFSLGEEEYALPITQVQEIIRYTEPRAVASEAQWIRGVISLRGKIIPVCDLAARLGVGADNGVAGQIVVVETASGTAGIVVGDVEEVLTVDATQIESVPSSGTDLIDAVVKIDDRLVVLLDADAIFAGVALES